MSDEKINDVNIKDKGDNSIPWSHIFFSLHKHCSLNKWEIMEYTLPQVISLMKSINKWIEFEVSTRVPMMGLGSGAAGGSNENEATEEDINQLARFLGG